MRIGMFTDTYEPHINGVVVSIKQFRTELQKAGHEVPVFVPEYSGFSDTSEGILRFPAKNYRSEAIKDFQKTWRFISIASQAKKAKIDVIHSHTPGNIGLWAIFLAQILKIPSVWTYHTLLSQFLHYVPLKGHYVGTLIERISTVVGNHATAMIAPTETIKEMLLAQKVKVPIHVVPTGITLPPSWEKEDPGVIRKRHHISPTRKLLCFVGRIAKEKKPHMLLDIVEELQNRGHSVHLVIIGDGPEKEGLEKEAQKKGLADRITFTGFLLREEMFLYLKASDLFVFPSPTETQGLVILEALATGTPVVVSRYMGSGEIVQDGKGGYGLEEDPHIYSDHIVRLLSDKDLYRQKVQEARDKGKGYTPTLCTERLLNVYNTLLCP